ncbi:MAG: hypothetical protein AAF719_01890 [Pseudomonadota bacterium]
MFAPIDDDAMLSWLRTQIYVLEAWREELACRPDIDVGAVRRLDEHYCWLTSEVARLETSPQHAA